MQDHGARSSTLVKYGRYSLHKCFAAFGSLWMCDSALMAIGLGGPAGGRKREGGRRRALRRQPRQPHGDSGLDACVRACVSVTATVPVHAPGTSQLNNDKTTEPILCLKNG